MFTTTGTIVIGVVFCLGGMGLVALSISMRPVDEQIAKTKKEIAELQQKTALINERTAKIKQSKCLPESESQP